MLQIPFFILIVTAFLIPSNSSHGFFSIKSAALISSVFSTGLLIICNSRLTKASLKSLSFFSLFFAFLLLWVFLTLFFTPSNTSWAQDQFKVFLSTLIPIAIALYLTQEKLVKVSTIFRTVILANFTYCLIKVTLITSHLIGLVDLFSLLKKFDIALMTMQIFGSLQRVQTSCDISTPFILFFLLNSEKLNVRFSTFFKVFAITFMFFSNVLTFSRFLLFVFFASFLLWLICQHFKRFLKVSFFLVPALFALFFMVGPENVFHLTQNRFFSYENRASDTIRIDQTKALMNKFYQAPFIGHGLGAFAKDNIRNSKIPHLYEVQWASFLMQFGLFGTAVLCLPLLYILFNFLSPHLSILDLAFASLFSLWIISGLTNPFLISLQSGLIYTIFYLASTYKRDQNDVTSASSFSSNLLQHSNRPFKATN